MGKALKRPAKMILVSCLAAGLAGCGVSTSVNDGGTKVEGIAETVGGNTKAGIGYWRADSRAAASIREYVRRVTDAAGDAFIPVEDRIAVFDLDGTLMGELYPSYFEYIMFIHRALHDGAYDAPTDMRTFAKALEAGVYGDGPMPDNHERLHAKFAGMAYAGMTPDELRAYTREYMASRADGFTNLARGDAFYRPMVSLVHYLEANGFTVYVVSGSDRTVVRELVKANLGIPENRVIGMSYTMVARNQDGADGLEYVYTKDDEVVLGGELIIKTLKMNKVAPSRRRSERCRSCRSETRRATSRWRSTRSTTADTKPAPTCCCATISCASTAT